MIKPPTLTACFIDNHYREIDAGREVLISLNFGERANIFLVADEMQARFRASVPQNQGRCIMKGRKEGLKGWRFSVIGRVGSLTVFWN